jgi:hypothetical protein
MKRLIITSPAFNGEINVLYGLDHSLQFIDFMKCDLNSEQMDYFKQHCPSRFDLKVDQFISFFPRNPRFNIADEKYFVTFDHWWNRYGLKRNRERSEKLWSKLSQADQAAALFKLGRYERYCQVNTWYTKADPDTYLRNKYWNNDWSK